MKRSLRLLTLLLLAACGRTDLLPPGSTLAAGTWGGDKAGILLGAEGAHVHMGCTYGDFPVPIALAPNGAFDVDGSYLLRAHPIAVGPTMPAGRSVTRRAAALAAAGATGAAGACGLASA